jgi:hypothetical protein
MYESTQRLLNAELERGASAVGRTVRGGAARLRSISDELREKDLDGPAATAIDRGADALDEIATYLQTAGGTELIEGVRRFGSERPWTLLTGSLLLGFTGSRVVKAAGARYGA